MVHLQRIYGELKEKGVYVLGYDSADRKDFAVEFIEENAITFPNVVDSSPEAREIHSRGYRVSAAPTTYVIDREGRVAAAFTGYSEGDRRGLDAVEAALAAGPAGGSRPRVAAAKGRGAVAGIVKGRDGRPLWGAIVRLQPARADRERGNRPRQVETDGAGHYELTDVKPGTYSVTVQVVGAANWVAPAGRIRVVAGEPVDGSVDIRDTELAGRVTREDTGAPLGMEEVQISIRGVDGTDVGAGVLAFADRDGRYAFPGLPPGKYEIWIFPHDPALEEMTLEVELPVQGRRTGVDFALPSQRVGRLRLKVTGADGRSVDAASFSLLTGPSSARTLRPVGAANGVFEFVLPEGERSILVSADGCEVGRVTAEIQEGKSTDRSLRLDPR